MKLILPPDGDRPAYLRIADWIGARIRGGELSIGDKLPSERALAEETGASRGTVKAAYQELKRRGVIHIAPGSGVYVRERPKPAGYDAVYQAVSLLREAGLGRGEIERLARDCAWPRLQNEDRPRLAWVDCCPEMLHPIQRQIEVECGFSVETVLLRRLLEEPRILEREAYQVIATSIEHYEELMAAAQEVLLRIARVAERVVISLAPESAGELSSIGPEEHTAVMCDSPEFFVIARRHLMEFGLKTEPVQVPFDETAAASAQSGGRPFNCAVLPPDRGYKDGACGRAADELARRGCRVIHLCHGVDVPSLRRLQELARLAY